MPRICNIPYATEDKQELNHALLKEVDALPVDFSRPFSSRFPHPKT